MAASNSTQRTGALSGNVWLRLRQAALGRRRGRLTHATVRALEAGERLQLHVLPKHYYSPVADRRWLQENPALWRRPLALPGLEWDPDAQLAWLEQVCAEHLAEVRNFGFLDSITERGIECRYGPIEAQVLHCVVRSLRPPTVVELGSGASTVLMSNAMQRNAGERSTGGRLLCIDPYASPVLESLAHVEVSRTPAQAALDDVLAQLGPGDLLFIDSTHALKTGSELARLYLDVIPGLPPGVLVHIHDVYLPYAYSPSLLSTVWDWQETVLVAALLTNNARVRVLCCQSMLHHEAPERLASVLPDYQPFPLRDGLDIDDALDVSGVGGHFPSSIWLMTGARTTDAAGTAETPAAAQPPPAAP